MTTNPNPMSTLKTEAREKDYRFNRNRRDYPDAVQIKRLFDCQYFCFKTKKVVGIFIIPAGSWGEGNWDAGLKCPVYIFRRVQGYENKARKDERGHMGYHPLPKEIDVIVPIFLLPPNCKLSWFDTRILSAQHGQHDNRLYSGLWGKPPKERRALFSMVSTLPASE